MRFPRATRPHHSTDRWPAALVAPSARGRLAFVRRQPLAKTSMARRIWVFNPHSGGIPIPERTRQRTVQRIEKYAASHYAGRYTRLDIRAREGAPFPWGDSVASRRRNLTEELGFVCPARRVKYFWTFPLSTRLSAALSRPNIKQSPDGTR
jgi:hypothetical protein